MSGLSLLTINNAQFTCSKDADKLTQDLAAKLGHRGRNVVARLAIARSLSIADLPPPIPASEASERGLVIKGVQLFDNVAVWTSLVVEHAEDAPQPRDVSSMRDFEEVVRNHWWRGINLLWQEWKDSGESFDAFVVMLAGRGGLSETGAKRRRENGDTSTVSGRACPVVIRLGDPGTDVRTGEPVDHLLNGPGTSPHFAIMGTLGTGKTRTAKHLLLQIHEQSGAPVILFDMAKGDLAADRELRDALNATVLRVPDEPVPLDVLHVRTGDRIVDAAMRFRDSFIAAMPNKSGGKQQDALREAAVRSLSGARQVRLTDVRDRVREVYAERRRPEDVVTTTFNDLTSWQLFEPSLPPHEFFSRSWIVDVHAAPEAAQRLVVFLILDAVYTYLKLLPDSDVDVGGHRALRLVLCIDEARKVLGYNQQSLVGLVRESRSKGGVLGLISQSPDDFDEDENFIENLGIALCFRTLAKPGPLKTLLGQVVDLAGLPNGIATTRLPPYTGPSRVVAWQ